MTGRIRGHGMLFNAVTIGMAVALVWVFSFPREVMAQQTVQVPAGTVVVLRTNTTLTPEALNVGDTVQLSAVSDVVVGGKVVIRAGALAKGQVTVSKDRNFIGIAAKLSLALQSVQAADGTTIPISGSKVVEGKDRMAASIGLSLICCILFALWKGGDAPIPAGTQVEALVTGTTAVTVQ